MASDPFFGEIMLFAGNFAPLGWATCDGQLLSIAANSSLYALIGTTYGGDGQTTFALPDLRGRVPLHAGNSYVLGQSGGVETVQLLPSQMPLHTHTVVADGNGGTTGDPTNAYFAESAPTTLYSSSGTPAARVMNPAMLTAAGGSQSHDNMQPYLTITFCIALAGAFPTA